jgi:hypothetical protein
MLILGKYKVFEGNEQAFITAPSVHEILEKHQVNKKEIASIIRGKPSKKPYLGHLLNSTIDVDQLDYLMRDAYYTGVAYGMIDLQRLLRTMMIYKGNLAMMRKGVSVVENILMARALMYSSVYFHKTVRPGHAFKGWRISMPSRPSFSYDRREIMVPTMGRFQQEIITRLNIMTYNRLIPSLCLIWIRRNQDGQREDVSEETEERELEDAFIPKGYVIIDIPRPKLRRSLASITRTSGD